MSFQNYRQFYGGGSGELVKTRHWRYRAIREEKWASPAALGRINHHHHLLEEEEQRHRVWEQRGAYQSRMTGRRQMVVSLRELPIGRPPLGLVPPPPPSLFRYPVVAPPPPPHPRFHPPPPPPPPSAPSIGPPHHPCCQQHGNNLHQRNDGQWKGEEEARNGGGDQQKKMVEEKMVEERHESRQKEGEEEREVDADQEIVNEPHGFRIRVEAKGFRDSDFNICIDPARVLALDAAHVEDNGNGTVTIKKLNRRWKLAEHIDAHSVRAFLAADGHVEIMGETLSQVEDEARGNEEEEEEEEDAGEEKEDAEGRRRGSMQAMPPTPSPSENKQF